MYFNIVKITEGGRKHFSWRIPIVSTRFFASFRKNIELRNFNILKIPRRKQKL
jgi:hypothetical protein